MESYKTRSFPQKIGRNREVLQQPIEQEVVTGYNPTESCQEQSSRDKTSGNHNDSIRIATYATQAVNCPLAGVPVG